MPAAPLDQAHPSGRKHGAQYLSVQGRFCDSRPEQKAELFDAARSVDGLELLAKVDDGATHSHFAVYRLTGG